MGSEANRRWRSEEGVAGGGGEIPSFRGVIEKNCTPQIKTGIGGPAKRAASK
jgi:hypothetical protein